MANTTHAKSCDSCPSGSYCLQAGIGLPCKKGYYCPAGTGVDLKPCPRGTIGIEEGYKNLLECQQCPSGKYCQYQGATTYTGNCQPGHWCGYGIDRPKPLGKSVRNIGFVNLTCYDEKETGFGGICPIGHFCKEGAQVPEGCHIGTYAPREGLSSCYPCMAGFYCPQVNMTTFVTYVCPRGHFCLNGTATIGSHTACPRGTYSNKTGLTYPDDCIQCSAGMFCDQIGN